MLNFFVVKKSNVKKINIRKVFSAENFRMVDNEINALTPGLTKPKIMLIRIRYPRNKFNSTNHV